MYNKNFIRTKSFTKITAPTVKERGEDDYQSERNRGDTMLKIIRAPNLVKWINNELKIMCMTNINVIIDDQFPMDIAGVLEEEYYNLMEETASKTHNNYVNNLRAALMGNQAYKGNKQLNLKSHEITDDNNDTTLQGTDNIIIKRPNIDALILEIRNRSLKRLYKTLVYSINKIKRYDDYNNDSYINMLKKRTSNKLNVVNNIIERKKTFGEDWVESVPQELNKFKKPRF